MFKVPDRPDLITVWPKNVDFPPFRAFVHYYRNILGKVIVVWTQADTSKFDFKDDVEKLMKDDAVIFLESVPGPGDDWRNHATNMALEHSDSDWVLFMEQDFMVQSLEELDRIWRNRQFFDVIGFKQADRLHPAFLLVSKRMINKTSKDFSAKPEDGYDHFGKFTRELNTKVILLDDLGIEAEVGYKHYNGLTHNINLCVRGETENIYKKDEFVEYLKHSETNIEVTEQYKRLVDICFDKLGIKFERKAS